MADQRTRGVPAIRRPRSGSVAVPPRRGARAVRGTPVLPLGPGSRLGRLHWGGQCVNCGDALRPGERGWIDRTDTEMLCLRCWPPLVIG